MGITKLVSNFLHTNKGYWKQISSKTQGPLPNSYLSPVLIRDFPAFKASSLIISIQGAK